MKCWLVGYRNGEGYHVRAETRGKAVMHFLAEFSSGYYLSGDEFKGLFARREPSLDGGEPGWVSDHVERGWVTDGELVYRTQADMEAAQERW